MMDVRIIFLGGGGALPRESCSGVSISAEGRFDKIMDSKIIFLMGIRLCASRLRRDIGGHRDRMAHFSTTN
jgi:hypothetical protein